MSQGSTLSFRDEPERRELRGGLLLVEDDLDLAALMTELLEEAGHRVARASHVEEAIAWLESGLEPELVVLDLRVGMELGLRLLPVLDARRSRARVLLCTGAAEGDGELPLGRRVVGRLGKPFSAAQLLAMVAQAWAEPPCWELA